MSKTSILCLVLALAFFIAGSEGLKCWHCIRGVNQFEESLLDSKCQMVNCPEGTHCYLEVLQAKDTSVRGCYPYKDCEVSKKNGASGCRVCKRDMCNAEPEKFHIR